MAPKGQGRYRERASAGEDPGDIVGTPRPEGDHPQPSSRRLVEASIPELASGEWQLISCNEIGGTRHLGKRILLCDLSYVGAGLIRTRSAHDLPRRRSTTRSD
jgi:hypothetical protein